MVDRQSRERLAQALRWLATGHSTNDEFDDGAFDEFAHRRDDPALAEMAIFGWTHYSDLRKYRLRGEDALSPQQRKSIARTILFLKTSQEYIYGDSIEDCTSLGKNGCRWILTIIAIAIVTGLVTSYKYGHFWLGFCIVGALGYGGMFATHFLSRLLTRYHSQRDAPQAHDSRPDENSFWPYADQRASMDAYRYWPFAGEREYRSALATPPFLCGTR